MATWIGVITNDGDSLLKEWVNEKTLHFDGVAAGTGLVDSVALLAQTGLVLSIINGEKVSGGIRLKIRITAPQTGYTLNQFGVWASVDGGTSSMIALFQHEEGIPIPSQEESPDFVYTFYALISSSNTSPWTVTVDPSALVTHEDMSQAIAAHAEDQNNPHNVSAEQIGAEPAGTAANVVNAHNISEDAHADLRTELKELADRINAVLDSDDETLDELSEIVAYIKSNKTLIDAITISKVSVSDIIDNLTTNVATKPLSAAQGVALKALIDAITVPTKTSQLTNDSGYLTSAPVASVNGKTGAVTLSASDVGAAPTSHGNHVPATETANNARFLRNDNTWQTVTPANIGLKTETWTFTLEDGSTVTKAVYVG